RGTTRLVRAWVRRRASSTTDTASENTRWYASAASQVNYRHRHATFDQARRSAVSGPGGVALPSGLLARDDLVEPLGSEVGAIGPDDGATCVVHGDLREQRPILQGREHGAPQLVGEIDGREVWPTPQRARRRALA